MELNSALKEYLIAIEQHRRECLEDLDDLSCIGVAKHWLKASGKNQPLDAYENFNKLAEL